MFDEVYLNIQCEINYPLTIVNRHLLFSDRQSDGLIVLDTGSPYSFHRNRSINIAGDHYAVRDNFYYLNSSKLSQIIGRNINIAGLLGMDIIKNYQLWINMPHFGNCLLFEKPESSLPRIAYHSKNVYMGVPCISMVINGFQTQLVFDTGTPVSYLKKDFLDGTPVSSKTQDCSPLLNRGVFDVSLHTLNVSINGGTFDVDFGEAPDEIEKDFLIHHIDGIIGYDLIDHFRIIIDRGNILFPPQGV